MEQRDIYPEDVEHCILTGKIIKEYPSDIPSPSCLLHGYTIVQEALHTVLAIHQGNLSIITTYHPDDRWEKDCATRKVRFL